MNSRDQILDTVWGHRHVTPGVLHRVMTLLRHALGEDAHHPRYLHTVHGVGYRFELPGAASSATPQAAPTHAGEILETSGVPGPPGSGRRRRVTDREAAPGWWGEYWRWLVPALLVAIAIVAIVAALQERPRRTPTAATPPTAVRP